MLFAYFTQRMEKLGKKNEREHYIQTVLHTHSQSIQHHWETWESWTEKEVRDWLYAMGGQEKAHVAQRFLENRIRGQGLKYLSEDDLRTKLEIREHGDRIWAWELLVDLRRNFGVFSGEIIFTAGCILPHNTILFETPVKKRSQPIEIVVLQRNSFVNDVINIYVRCFNFIFVGKCILNKQRRI